MSIEQATQESRSAGRYSGNVLLIAMNAQTQSMDATNEALELALTKQAVVSGDFNAHVAELKASAALLPEAGKKGETDATYNLSSGGISKLAIIGLAGAALAVGVIGLTLMALGVATVGVAGFGAIFIAVAAVIIGAAYAMVQGKDNSYTTYMPSHVEYDPGKQAEANTNVQALQSLIQNDQNKMNRIMSQDFNPASELKQTNASMIQSLIQGLRALVWAA